MNWNVSELLGRDIVSASANFAATYSWSCSARGWEVQGAGVASTASRWTNQPGVSGPVVSSSETYGYSSACPARYVAVGITPIVSAWAAGGTAVVGLRVKAQSETDNFGWKYFSSAEGGNPPYLEVDYNGPPAPATDLHLTAEGESVDAAGVRWTRSAGPVASIASSDPDGNALQAGAQLTGNAHVQMTSVSSFGRAGWSMADLRGSPLVPYQVRELRVDVFDGRLWSGNQWFELA